MNSNNKVDTKSNELVEYMNKKYDDDFSYKSPFGGGVGATTKQIIVSSKKFPQYDIWVEYSYNENKFNDNYTDYKFKGEFEEWLKNALSKKLDSSVAVNRQISTSGSYVEYDSNVDFSDYINTAEQIFSFTAVVMTSESLDSAFIESSLSSILDNVESGFFGTLYFVDEDIDAETFLSLNIYEKSKYSSVKVKKESKGATIYEWR